MHYRFFFVDLHYRTGCDFSDLTVPIMEDLGDVSLSCGDPFSPEVIGSPQVTDNRDVNPEVTYEDIPQAGCAMNRMWTARDAAGNTIMRTQVKFLPSISASGTTIVLSHRLTRFLNKVCKLWMFQKLNITAISTSHTTSSAALGCCSIFCFLSLVSGGSLNRKFVLFKIIVIESSGGFPRGGGDYNSS